MTRKTCVLWRSSALARLLAASAVAALTAGGIAAQVSTSLSETLPLLTADDLTYVGGFRLPAESVNGDSFSMGGRPMAFNPATQSLYIGSRAGRVAEVSIPLPVSSADVNALPWATFLQPFTDPTEGRLHDVAPDGVAIDGLMVYDNRLYGTASIYYDANNTQRVSHYARSLLLSESSFSGWSQVWESERSGFVSGPMALVPAEWQASLGGPAVTGQCCIPIVTRTSWGPAAFAFDPARVGEAVVPASPLVYYTGAHPTLGAWDAATPTYGATMQIGGMALIAGTRTALYVGRNGTGPNCYGNGTSDPALDGTVGPDGATWCYDPTTSDKGSHAYPYRYQIWAYDLNDFAAVKAGLTQPWEVVPYGVWPFDLPTPEPSVRLGGVAYDAERQLLYIAQSGADKDGYAYRPIIHALQIAVAARPPADAPAAPPATSTVSAVSIAADLAAPQAPGTTIRFTADPTGGAAPHQYKWWTYDGQAWTPAGDWTTSAAFAWTPSYANAAFRVAVWVRSAGNARDEEEAKVAVDYPVSGGTDPSAPAPASARVTAVSITADLVAPQAAGTTLTWTAAPVGGTGPLQYKWWTYDGESWVVSGGWTTSRTFEWTPAVGNPAYRIGVWVKSAGNGADEQETSTSEGFAIAGATATAGPVTAVTLTADRVAPLSAGSTIVWTATPTGGRAPLDYKWWVYTGDGWFVIGEWSTSNAFAWTPATANAAYRIGVWVRSAGNTVDAMEASTAEPFAIVVP